ncbi:MAG: hypothetical protein ACTH2Q_19990 [Propionibacteriaceae bacterium]
MSQQRRRSGHRARRWAAVTAAAALLVAGNVPAGQAESADWQVNGHEVGEQAETNLRWLAANTYPRLSGDRETKLETMSVVAWWSLKEGALYLPQESSDLGSPEAQTVHDFNLCTRPEGDVRIGQTETCAAGKAWQVGISGIQVPNVDVATVEAKARELYPGESADQVLTHTLSYAGYGDDSAVAETVLADRGDLRKSWLLRNHGVGFALQEQFVRTECIDAAQGWCYGTGWDTSEWFAPDPAGGEQARADLLEILAQLTADTADPEPTPDPDPEPEPEPADTFTAEVWDTGGVGLSVRAEPTPDSEKVGHLNTGDSIEIACQVEGPEVTNDVKGVTSTLWDHAPATGGYVSDAWVLTGVDGRVDVPDSSESEPPQPPEEPGDPAAPVTGIAEPCSADHPFPADSGADAVVAGMAKNWNLAMQPGDKSWTDGTRGELLRIFWETLDAIDCTPFLQTVVEKNAGSLGVHAGTPIHGGWADYGLTNPGALTFDPEEQQGAIDRGIPETVAQNVIHELAHAYSNDRPAPAYYAEYLNLYGQHGGLSNYGQTAENENFADAAGFYVARCSQEAFETGGELLPNPYDGGYAEYYDYAREQIFGGKEFGPAPGTAATC